jgi:uncharacterized membrane protein SirB2
MNGKMGIFFITFDRTKKSIAMFKIIFYTHLVSVVSFLLIYLIKTILLLSNKEDALTKFTKSVKVPEMIVSTLFLLSGIYLLTQVPSINMFLIIKIIIVFASIPLAVIGFKKKNKGLAVVSFILIVAAYGLAEMSKKKSSKVVTSNTVATTGEGIYTANCSRCHGDDGKLGLAGAVDLSMSTMDLVTKVNVITNGKNGIMPAYGMLGEEQIQAVAAYTETLKK